MKVGVIARSEDRGLGLQTWEAARHLEPAKVLLVVPRNGQFPPHLERYTPYATTVVTWDGEGLDERVVRPWLEGLDAVYSAETLYDWRIPEWTDANVCLHANVEMLRPDRAKVEGVTWWAPTPWRLDLLPAGTRVVPLPVATDRFALPYRPSGDTPRFLHVAGHVATLDRNGTHALSRACRQVTRPIDLVVRGQDGNLPPFKIATGGRAHRHPIGTPDYWELYDGDVLVMPRRYGGLCMPVQEAMAAGLCVLMPDIAPNNIWPGPRFEVHQSVDHEMAGGVLPVADIDPGTLAQAMDRLHDDPHLVRAHQEEARAWAETHSWEALLPLWMTELARS